jgi:hypothetical protein
MIAFFFRFPAFINALFCSRYNLSLEILALRQQVSVLKRKNPRPRLKMQDRILLRLIKPGSAGVLADSSPFRSRRNTGALPREANHIVPSALRTLSGVMGKSRIHFPIALYIAEEVIADMLAPIFSPIPFDP